jgi:transcriptional regulator with XRE-family HTH domain
MTGRSGHTTSVFRPPSPPLRAHRGGFNKLNKRGILVSNATKSMPPKKPRLPTFIKDRRAELGLSMNQVAERVGVSKSNLHYWESGEYAPKPMLLEPLANALEVNYDDLFAAAGITRPAGLPAYSSYLRTKYGHLPEEALAELEEHMRRLEAESGGSDADSA